MHTYTKNNYKAIINGDTNVGSITLYIINEWFWLSELIFSIFFKLKVVAGMFYLVISFIFDPVRLDC